MNKTAEQYAAEARERAERRAWERAHLRRTGWYIIQTNPNCETKAAGELRRAGCRVYVPQYCYDHRNRRTGVQSVKTRPLMTGYLLIRFTPDQIGENGIPKYAIARACQGVKNFVRIANDAGEWEPFPIHNKEVADLMNRQRAREFGRPELGKARRMRLQETYKKGNMVRVVKGPFSSFLAEISRLHKDGQVEVEIDVFGRPTKLMLDDPDFYLRNAA